MPSELVSCPECRRKLRVPNDLVGKLVKCPTCGHTFTADPIAQAPPPEPAPSRPEPAASRPEPVARTSKVTRDEDDDLPRRRARYDRDDEDDDDRPRRRSRYGRDDDEDDDWRGRRRDTVPHRGGAVLALGVIGLVLTLLPAVPLGGLVCGIIAWVMGNSDLAEMRAGRMDREGESQTSSGRICGMIAVILHIVAVVGLFGFCCLMGLAARH